MGRELPPSRATARAQDAAVQVGSIRPALPQHARRRPQYVQPSTPSHLPVDAADLQSRSGSAMVRRRCSDVRPNPLAPFQASARCRDKALAHHPDLVLDLALFLLRVNAGAVDLYINYMILYFTFFSYVLH